MSEQDGLKIPESSQITKVKTLHSGALLVEYKDGHAVLFPAPRMRRFFDAFKLLFRR